MRWLLRRRAITAYLTGKPITPRMQVELDRIAIEQEHA